MEWQPIDTAPTDGTPIVIYYPTWDEIDDIFFVAEWDPGREGMEEVEATWWSLGYGHTGDGATHWMPLPEPPK